MSQVAAALESSLRAHALEIPTLRILPNGQQASDDNASNVRGAEGTLSNIARMGRDTGADEVLIGRIQPARDTPGGARLQLMAIDSQDEAILRKTAFLIAGPEEADKAVATHWGVIYGIDGVGYVEVPGSTNELSVNGVVVGHGPGPFAVSVGPHELAVADRSQRVVILPGETVRADSLIPEKIEPPTPVAIPGPIAAADPPAGETGATLLLYSGAALGAVGLAALGTGAYFGMSSESLNREVEAVPNDSEITQLEVVDLNRRAADAARNANIFLIVGAVATAAGATLVALDLWVFDSDATAHVTAQSNGGAFSAGVVLKW